MDCYIERAFYYWRHGLYGHVQLICQKGLEVHNTNLFLILYNALSKGYLGQTEAALHELSRFQIRGDLTLLYSVSQYCVLSKAKNPDYEAMKQLEATFSNDYSKSNPLSIYYSALVAWLFNKVDLCTTLLKKDENTTLIKVLRIWIRLTNGNYQEALDCFDKLLEDPQRTFDIMILYGKAVALAGMGRIPDSIQVFSKIMSKYDFPEIAIEKCRVYMSIQKYELTNSVINTVRDKVFSKIEVDLLASIIQILNTSSVKEMLNSLDDFIEVCMLYEHNNWEFQSKVCFALGTISSSNLSVFDRTLKLAILASETSNEHPFAQSVLGYHQFLAHNYVAASSTIQNAIDKDSKSQFALEFQVKLLINTCRYSEAQDILDLYGYITKKHLSLVTLQTILMRKQTRSNEANIPILIDALERNVKYIETSPFYLPLQSTLETKVEQFIEFYMHYRFDCILDALDELIIYDQGRFLKPNAELISRISSILKFLQTVTSKSIPIMFYNAMFLKKCGKYSDSFNILSDIFLLEGKYRFSTCLMAAADIFLRRKETVEYAANCLEEAVKLDPTLVTNLEFVILKAKVDPETIPNIIPFFNDNSQSFLTYLDFIDICIKNGRYELAAVYIRKASEKIEHQSQKGILIAHQAMVFASRNEIDKAVKSLQTLKKHKAYVLNSVKTEAQIYLIFQKDYQMYLNCFIQLCEKFPLQEHYILLGQAYEDIYMYDDAINAYQQALKETPVPEILLQRLIYVLVAAHRFDDAVKLFSSPFNSMQGNTYILLDVVKLMVRLKRYKEAQVCVSKALRMISPIHALLTSLYLTQEGLIYLRTNNTKEAERSLQSALDLAVSLIKNDNSNFFVTILKEQISELYKYMAENYLEISKKEKAIEAYVKSIEYNETNIESIISLFEVYKSRSDTEKCLQICRNYLEIDPSNETIGLLLTSVVTREFQESIKVLEKVLAVHPTYYRTLVRFVELCARAGHLKLAWTYIEKSKGYGALPGYNFVSGLYYRYIGAIDKAKKYFKKAAQSVSWELPSKIALIEILINPDRKFLWFEKEPLSTPESLSEAEQIISALKIDEVMQIRFKAEILCSYNTNESVKQAISLLSEAIKTYPNSIDLTVALARCYTRMGDFALATKYLGFVLTNQPFHENFSYFEEAYLMKAQIVTKETNFNSAQHFIFLALSLDMCCLKAWHMSAKVHKSHKMYNEASVAYGQCWNLTNKQDQKYGIKYAKCTMLANKPEDAIATCRILMESSSNMEELKETILIPSYRKLKR